MRGAVLLRLITIGARQRRAGGPAGGNEAQTAVAGYELAAPGQIGRIGQPAHRHGDEIAVGGVELAVGIGEPLRFDEQMPSYRVLRPQRLQVEALEHAQEAEDRHAARARRAHPADAVAAIGPTYRRALLGGVAG